MRPRSRSRTRRLWSLSGYLITAWLGFTTAWKAPLVFWDLGMELLRRRSATHDGAFDPAYHGVDPEVLHLELSAVQHPRTN